MDEGVHAYRDFTIGLAGGRQAGGLLREAEEFCRGRDGRFDFVFLGDGDVRCDLHRCGFVVIAGIGDNGRECLRQALKEECIPLVRISGRMPEGFPEAWLWERTDEVARKIADLRRTPRTLAAARAVCRELSSSAFVWSYGEILDFARRLPESNGGRFYGPSPCRIGVICDQFYYDSVRAAASFVYLPPVGWERKLREIEVLLVVSTWNGLRDGEWRGIATEGSEKWRILNRIIDTARSKGLPVIFYSKEDPPHYRDFLATAKRCDCVFTTCAEMLDSYRRDCGHDRVAVCRFGINPLFHNPVGCRNKKSTGALFSGSWYAKFPERCADLQRMFYGVRLANRDLQIVDRFSEVPAPDGRYAYPVDFIRSVHPAVDHALLQNLHKLFDWSININTVKDSQTMFANRAYELQATGTLLLSNYSIGMNALLPLVGIVNGADDVVRTMNGLTGEELYERQMASVRFVMTGETCFDRISEMLAAVGKPGCRTHRSMAVVADRVTEGVRRMFDAQTYPDRTLFAKEAFGEADYGRFDLVAFWNERSHYGMFYLEDLANAFKYTDSDYVTKDAYLSEGRLVAGVEHDYVSRMPDKYRSMFWSRAFGWRQLVGMEGGRDLAHGYSVDPFNYDAKPAGCVRARSEHPAVSVIVAAYNNGWTLYGKAFASVLKCEAFGEMEIVIVDDGSTDGRTPEIIRTLARRHPNVRTHFFPAGGSGSASRPRNKGVAMAAADFVLFLDPDDELVPDGVAALLESAKRESCDLVVGDYLIMRTKAVRAGLYSDVHGHYPGDCVRDGGADLIRRLNFKAVRLHSMIVRRTLIVDGGLEQEEGAFGEDTLFSYRLLERSRKTRVIPNVVQVYYEAVPGSAVNAIDASYMRKCRLGILATVKWLRASGLYGDFVDRRLNEYVRGWLFGRLMKADPQGRLECVRQAAEAIACYEAPAGALEAVVGRFMALCGTSEYARAWNCLAKTFGRKDAEWRRDAFPEGRTVWGRVLGRRACVRVKMDSRESDVVRIRGTLTAPEKPAPIEKALAVSFCCRTADGRVLRSRQCPWSEACGGEFAYAACRNGRIGVDMRVCLPPGTASLELALTNWSVNGPVTVETFEVDA